MKQVYIDCINELIKLEKNILKICFNSKDNYKIFCFNIYKNITYSIDNTPIDINKYGYVIYNPFEIDLNDKKINSLLYKKLEKCEFEGKAKAIQCIEEQCFNYFEEMALNIDTPFEYDSAIDLSKLFGAFNIRVCTENEYLNIIVNYLKFISEIFKTKIIISFGLLALINDDEEFLLDKELEQLNMVLIDISFENSRKEDLLIIDNDWCII